MISFGRAGLRGVEVETHRGLGWGRNVRGLLPMEGLISDESRIR